MPKTNLESISSSISVTDTLPLLNQYINHPLKLISPTAVGQTFHQTLSNLCLIQVSPPHISALYRVP